MSGAPHVAVLGGGIMGSATALHLSRLGARVTLFDRAKAPFEGASRWNEGKIHLGYLYSADPSLKSANAMITQGLDFADQVRRLTGLSLASATTPVDDLFLVHRDSVVSSGDMADYFARITAMVRTHPDADRYLADVSAAELRVLDRDELAAVADTTRIVAGYSVPERSVNTNIVADAFVAALNDDTSVTLHLGEEVVAVDAAEPGSERGWQVRTAVGRHGPFDSVVNALWEGRPAIDRSVGHRPDVAPQHRFRVSLFVTTDQALHVPSAVVAVGPFGDVKNYDGRTFYVSWYPAGLLARSEEVDPPPRPRIDAAAEEQIIRSVFDGLCPLLPWVTEIQQAAATIRVRGGWVYSQGQGRLDDPGASIHRRDLLGVTSRGTYHSVDTGKYSVAPTLAEQLAQRIVAGSG